MADPLATYTFLPWLRQGIAGRISTVDTLGAASPLVERASVSVSLAVNKGDPITNDVQLVGPGDIVGINPRAIVKSEPRNWITDFEPNYLPFIEFYDEDFPWRYTPAGATADHRLRPWIFLAVLTEEEFERKQLPGALLAAITLNDTGVTLLPTSDQIWAWAHVHVSKDITDGNQSTLPEAVDALENLVEQNPDEASSRVLCPRRLKANTGYYAFLIPAFEAGRLAGLGQATAGVDALKPSWGDGQVDYPIYYEWFFRTGLRGDFEFLVNLLEPRPVDQRVGIRDMDMQEPNYGVSGMTQPPVIGLEGALRAPGTASRSTSWPPDPPPPFVPELQHQVNFQTDLLSEPGAEGHPNPIISPPLYGRWHAKVKRLAVDEAGWVNELNGDPRLRVPGGFGTRVVQTNQEDYVQRAWQQLGDILEANRKIRHVQLSIAASHRVYTGKLLPLSDEQIVASMQAVLAQVKGSPETLHEQVRKSQLPLAALRPAFRKVTRPRGVLMKKVAPQNGGRSTNVLARLNEGEITAAPRKTAPENQISLNDAARQIIPSWVPDWLARIAKFNRWIIVVLLLLVLAFFFLTGVAAILVLGLPALTALWVGSEWLRRRVTTAESSSEEGLTVETIRRVPPLPAFTITEPGVSPPSTSPGGPNQDSQEAASFRIAVTDLHQRFEVALPKPAKRDPLNLAAATQTLTRALNPVRTIPNRTRSFIAIPASFKPLRPLATIETIMAHPVFSDPMYAPLRDISSELLMPNLNLIPMNTISLLETNRRFIESYMVGVNHEMSRELLWRQYPTDQRGSYFRQFWDVGDAVNRDPSKSPAQVEKELRDIKPIHTWRRDTALGTHENRFLPTGSEQAARLVLVIRGDLLKRYPTAVIYAQKAKWDLDDEGRDIRVLDESNPAENLQEPLFKAEIVPDLKFLGFNLTATQAKGSEQRSDNDPGWFFGIQERPGEPRFGLDVPGEDTPPKPTEWNELAWSHLATPEPINFIDLEEGPETDEITDPPDANIQWGSNAADMAYILYQVPVMVAFHASDMLKDLA